ncbi:hypothetical protein EYF80_030193 [Liparis tanakae]|uniref:Uncharacterized protein n=1 Tax=Liparis tanakae TaxID=230148 RepID=A0A4Z2H216_9TELE|nr:hypothetical protein EYF80_030193 [Liparis tanakae]
MEENGSSLSGAGEALSRGWEQRLSLVTPVSRLRRNAALLSNTCPLTGSSCWQMMDGGRGGRRGKCHKDTSVAEADAFAKKSLFQRRTHDEDTAIHPNATL